MWVAAAVQYTCEVLQSTVSFYCLFCLVYRWLLRKRLFWQYYKVREVKTDFLAPGVNLMIYCEAIQVPLGCIGNTQIHSCNCSLSSLGGWSLPIQWILHWGRLSSISIRWDCLKRYVSASHPLFQTMQLSLFLTNLCQLIQFTDQQCWKFYWKAISLPYKDKECRIWSLIWSTKLWFWCKHFCLSFSPFPQTLL